MSDQDPPPTVRRAALSHALRSVHPDRKEAEVEATATVPEAPGETYLVGVKVHPRGYISTAKYALVTVDDEGAVLDAEACTGQELRRQVETAGE